MEVLSHTNLSCLFSAILKLRDLIIMRLIPVAKIVIVRTLLSVTVAIKWEVHHIMSICLSSWQSARRSIYKASPRAFSRKRWEDVSIS